MCEGRICTILVKLIAATMLLMSAQFSHAQTIFTVNSVGDEGNNNPGDGFCWTGDSYETGGPIPIAVCTLRAAIEEANASGGAIEIHFGTNLLALNGQDGQSSVITPQSALPKIENKISILGDTHLQWDSEAQLPRVHIDGGDLGFSRDGLVIDGADGTLIQHIAVYNFTGNGIEIQNSDEVQLIGNRIGLASWSTLSSDMVFGNTQWGLSLRNATFSNLDGNWISANDSGGIILRNNSANNLLINNRVGLGRANSAGDQAIGNTDFGILVSSTAGSDNQIGQCTLSPQFIETCQGNIVVASTGSGIVIDGSGQSLVFNSIGVSPEYPEAEVFGNAANGLWINSDDNQIITGLNVAATGNVIGHSGGIGLRVFGSSANNVINRTLVGIDRQGNDVGNTLRGIQIDSTAGANAITNAMVYNNETGIQIGAANTTVSGSEIISNGSMGIEITTAPITIEGNVIGGHTLAGITSTHTLTQWVNIFENHIGVRPDGTPIGNGRGILVANGRSQIGGPDETGNIIGFNTFAGILIDAAHNAYIRSNYIGIMPDSSAAGNFGPGIEITSSLPGQSANAARIGYAETASIPFNPIPDGSGEGGLGNIITNNSVGIKIHSEEDDVTLERHRIRGNRIFGNTDGGIQLGKTIGDIDPGGGASGPNTLLNHPQLDDGATWLDTSTSPQTLHFRYRVPTSTDNADYPLRIDFYAVNSGETQGRSWVGFDEYSESDAGQWRSGTLEPRPGILTTAFDGTEIVAKAIDADGNTSEFSAEAANVATQGDPQPNELLVTANTDEPNQDPNSAICNTGQPEVAPAVAHCTLRAALQAASNFSDTAVIEFWENIPHGNGVTTFQPETPLPPVTGSTEIAGETHPFFSTQTPRPQIIIRNDLIDETPEVSGLRVLDALGASIRFVAVTEAAGSGIEVSDSSHVSLRGNLVGLVPHGGQDIQAGNDSHGIAVWSSTNIIIESNRIAVNGNDGIRLGTDVTNSLIFANQIGVAESATGRVAAPNGQNGIFIDYSAGNGNQIGHCVIDPVLQCIGNLIGASGLHGIRVSSDGNSLASNLIGFNPANPADEDFSLGSNGIFIDSDGNTISGLSLDVSPGIIGNASVDAIQLSHNASNNTISKLLLGVDGQGNDIGNGGSGIRVISGGNNLISQNRIANNEQMGISISADVGPNEIKQNEILDNDQAGIFTAQGGQDIDGNIIGGSSAGIRMHHDFIAGQADVVNITNNFIGVTPDGEDIGNVTGIVAHEAGFANIGLPDRGNVIANNGFGIRLDRTSGNFVQSNHIGVLPDGTPAGNSNGGVIITSTEDNGEASDNTVGFQATVPIPFGYEPEDGGPGNIIAHNGGAGVVVFSGFDNTTLVNNSIRGNRFYANVGQAIDLGLGGDTIDPGGGETGHNNLQNFPVFEAAETLFNEQSGEIEFNYVVNTTIANASYPLRVDFFIADDASGQGRIFLHTDEYAGAFADQPKVGSFEPPPGTNVQGAFLVATATDSDGNTSQFSHPVQLGERPDEIFQDRFEEAEE